MPRHYIDEKGELKAVAKRVIGSYRNLVDPMGCTPWDLRILRFQFTFRDEPRTDEDQRDIAAQIKRLSPELRDLYGFDVQLEVCEPIWRDLTDRFRLRLIDHELMHVRIVWDLKAELPKTPKTDKEGRISIEMVPHDISIKRFRAEFEKYGLSDVEMDQLSYLLELYRKAKKGEIPVYTQPAVLRDKEDE